MTTIHPCRPRCSKRVKNAKRYHKRQVRQHLPNVYEFQSRCLSERIRLKGIGFGFSFLLRPGLQYPNRSAWFAGFALPFQPMKSIPCTASAIEHPFAFFGNVGVEAFRSTAKRSACSFRTIRAAVLFLFYPACGMQPCARLKLPRKRPPQWLRHRPLFQSLSGQRKHNPH